MILRLLCYALVVSACSVPLSGQYFQQYQSIDSGTYGAAFADLNGDGKTDTVYYGEKLEVLLNGQSAPVGYALSSTQFSGDTSASLLLQDVNGDGKPDIIVPRGNGVDILLNNGNGSFQSAVPYITNDDFSAFALADMNGDGKPDLVYVASSDIVSDSYSPGGGQHVGMLAVALNTGSAFGVPKYYALTSAPATIAVGDLNGDGHPDVVVGGSLLSTLAPLTYFLNTGNGGLGSAHTIGSLTSTPVVVADLNGDGIADIVASDLGQAVILFGDTSGVLTINQRLPLSVENSSGTTYQVADLNKDGHPDIFAGGDGAAVALNDGTGHFGSFTHYAFAGDTARLGDINGDGYPDLIWNVYPQIGESLANNPYALNNGDGTFNAPQSSNTNAYLFADFNGDGLLDGAAALQSQDTGQFYLNLQLANGDGTFRHIRGPGLPIYYYGYNLAAGDLNGDGKQDIVYSILYSPTEGNEVLQAGGCLNQGSASFTCKAVTALATSSDYALIDLRTIADFDGTRVASYLFVNGGTLYAAKSNKDGTFAKPVALLSLPNGFTNPAAVRVADFNGDGKPDLLIVTSYEATLYLRQTSGSYTQAASTLPEGAVLGVADVNADGIPDVLLVPTTGGANYAQIQPYLGDGKGNFTAGAAYTTNVRYGSLQTLEAGDIDGDGFPDLLYEGYGPLGASLNLALNDGKGNFTLSGQQFGYWTRFVPGRLNANAVSSGTKKLDLLVSDQSYNIAGLFNLQNTQTTRPALPRLLLSVSSNPLTVGQTATLNAKVSAASGSGTPAGTVTFWSDATLLATVPLQNGTASVTFSTAGVPAGEYYLSASYQPSNTAFQTADSNFSKAALENSNAHLTNPYVSVSYSAFLTLGMQGTITANIVPVAAAGTPGGNVTFYAQDLSAAQPFALATVPLTGGKASVTVAIPTSLDPSEYALTARYSGGSGFAASGASYAEYVPGVFLRSGCTLQAAPVSTSGAPGDAISVAVTSNVALDAAPLIYLDGVMASSRSNVESTSTFQLNGYVPALTAGAHLLTVKHLSEGNGVGECTSTPINFTVN